MTSPVYLLIDPANLPEEWRPRAVQMAMVAVAVSEIRPVPAVAVRRRLGRATRGELERLILAGASPRAIAREVHVSVRTAYRWLAALRAEWDVASNDELASALHTKLASQMAQDDSS